MIKRLAHDLAPGAYRFARKIYLNSCNHGRWLWSERRSAPAAAPTATTTYTSDYYATWSAWDYDGFAAALAHCFQPRSILDVGCGPGLLLSAWKRTGPEVRTLGLEHSRDALAEAHRRGLEVADLDLAHDRQTTGAAASPWSGQFDLVLCFEVAEHLPFWRAQPLATFLAARGPSLAFSAAQPGQGGILHLNEQPPAYWVGKFARAGLHWDEITTTELRAALRPLKLPPWYHDNLLVFRRPDAR